MILRSTVFITCFVTFCQRDKVTAQLPRFSSCNPGTFYNTSSKQCDVCLTGFYTAEHNNQTKCNICATCTGGKTAISKCTITQNTICKCGEGHFDYGDGCKSNLTAATDSNAFKSLMEFINNSLESLQTSINESSQEKNLRILDSLGLLNQTLSWIQLYLINNVTQVQVEMKESLRSALLDSTGLLNRTLSWIQWYLSNNITQVLVEMTESQRNATAKNVKDLYTLKTAIAPIVGNGNGFNLSQMPDILSEHRHFLLMISVVSSIVIVIILIIIIVILTKDTWKKIISTIWEKCKKVDCRCRSSRCTTLKDLMTKIQRLNEMLPNETVNDEQERTNSTSNPAPSDMISSESNGLDSCKCRCCTTKKDLMMEIQNIEKKLLVIIPAYSNQVVERIAAPEEAAAAAEAARAAEAAAAAAEAAEAAAVAEAEAARAAAARAAAAAGEAAAGAAPPAEAVAPAGVAGAADAAAAGAATSSRASTTSAQHQLVYEPGVTRRGTQPLQISTEDDLDKLESGAGTDAAEVAQMQSGETYGDQDENDALLS